MPSKESGMNNQQTPAELVRERIAERKSGWSRDQHRCYDLLCAQWAKIMTECYEEESVKHRRFYRHLDRFLEFMDGQNKYGLLRYESEFLSFVTNMEDLRHFTEKEFSRLYWEEHVGKSYFCIASRKQNRYGQTRVSSLFIRFVNWMNAKTMNRLVTSFDHLADLGIEIESRSMDSFFHPQQVVPEKSLPSLMSIFLRDVADYQHESMVRAMLSILKQREQSPVPDDEKPTEQFPISLLKAELAGGQYEATEVQIFRNRRQVLARFAAFLILRHNEKNPNFGTSERSSVFLRQVRWAGLDEFIKGNRCPDMKGLLERAKQVLHTEPVRRKYVRWITPSNVEDELRDLCSRLNIRILDDCRKKEMADCVLARLDGFPNGQSYRPAQSKVFVYRNGKIMDFRSGDVCYLGDLLAEEDS